MEPTLLKNLFFIFKQYRHRFAKALFLIFLANFFMVFNPLILRQALVAIDPQAGHPEGLWVFIVPLIPHWIYISLWPWVGLLLSIAVISNIFRNRMRYYFFSVGGEVEKETRTKIFGKIQSQSMAFFDRHGTGELLSRLTNDMTAYRDVLGPGIMFPSYFVTVVFPGIALMATISVDLTLISLIPLITIPIFNALTKKTIYFLSNQVQEGLGNLSNMAQEHYSGIKILKSYTAEELTFRMFQKQCWEQSMKNLKLVTLLGKIFPFFTLVTRTVTVLLVTAAGFIILKAWNTLGAADFVSFMWIQSYIYLPVLMLGWAVPIYTKGRAAYDRLYGIYMEPIEVQDSGREDLHIPPKANIAFKNLTFTYPLADKPSLKNINLEIRGGTFLGITGPIGGGKSTLFKVLNREYEIPKGMVLIGDHDLRDYPLTPFRRELVTVEQVPFLFSKTIAENISFGKERATREEMDQVLVYADLYQTIMGFPEKYETVVGERGQMLSGGQKQRVAMARAFLVDRSILLLDDIFSAVDASTEKRIFEAMRKNFQGKTIILITHRVSILLQLDRVIYLQAGKVLEDGTPQELIQQKGCFAALADLQKMDFTHG